MKLICATWLLALPLMLGCNASDYDKGEDAESGDGDGGGGDDGGGDGGGGDGGGDDGGDPGDGVSFRVGPGRTGAMPGPDRSAFNGAAVAWQADLKDLVGWDFSAELAGDMIVVDDVMVLAGRLYDYYGSVPSEGVVAAVDVDGDLVWQRRCDETFWTPTASWGGLLFAADEDALHGLSLTDGAQVWTRAGEYGESAPVVAGGVVYVCGDDEGLLALDAATGAELWLAAVACKGAPSAADGRVFVGDYRSTLWAVDAATGDILWDADQSGINGMIAVRDGLVLSTGDDLSAFDAETGSVAWRTQGVEVDGDADLPPLAVADGAVWVWMESDAAPDGAMASFDLHSGEQQWSFADEDAFDTLNGSPSPIGDTVYWPADATDGDLLCALGPGDEDVDDCVQMDVGHDDMGAPWYAGGTWLLAGYKGSLVGVR